MKNLIFKLLLGALVFPSIIYAGEDQRLYRSAYYLGRGDTGIAIADDAEALSYNPAGLAQGQGIYKKTVILSPQLELSKDTQSLTKQLAIEKQDQVSTLISHIGKTQHLGLYNFTGLVFRRAAIAAISSAQTNLLVKKGYEYGGLETVSANFSTNQALAVSIADDYFNQKLMIGVTGKYIYRGQAGLEFNIIDADQLGNLKQSDMLGYGDGMGVDLGAMFHIITKGKRRPKYHFGLTMKNIGDTHIKSKATTTALTDLYQTLNFGFAMDIATQLSKFRVLFDYLDIMGKDETNNLKKLHIGAEISVKDIIGITAGLSQGYATGGIYVDIYLLRMDFGVYTEEMSERVGVRGDERYFARLVLGF